MGDKRRKKRGRLPQRQLAGAPPTRAAAKYCSKRATTAASAAPPSSATSTAAHNRQRIDTSRAWSATDAATGRPTTPAADHRCDATTCAAATSAATASGAHARHPLRPPADGGGGSGDGHGEVGGARRTAAKPSR